MPPAGGSAVSIQLIATVPRTRRSRVTAHGRQVMGRSLYLREHHFPNTYATLAA
jgi:hypothetical protein